MILVTALLLVAAPDRVQLCSPKSTEGVRVVVDQRYARVTLDQFLDTYFSEEFNAAAAPIMGIKSRELVADRHASGGLRHRRVRMRPEMALPAPLLAFGSQEQLRYDEVSTYDARARRLRFFIDSEACDQLKYSGTISFIPDGDGVRLRIDALLQVDAFLVGDVVEAIVQGGVRDGYAKLATFMQAYLDDRGASRRDAITASTRGRVADRARD